MSTLPDNESIKPSISVGVRFAIFKRDAFTCRYCGRTTPAVVLEVDHIVPRCEGGSDDPINLATSCWECNRGKGGVPLSQVIAGEDPTERAMLLLERDRQLREYNAVLVEIRDRRNADVEDLSSFWYNATGYQWTKRDKSWLWNQLAHVPAESIRFAMNDAIVRNKIAGLRYVSAIVRNMRAEGRTYDADPMRFEVGS